MSDMHGVMETNPVQQFRLLSPEFVTPTRPSSRAVDTSPPNQGSDYFESFPEGAAQAQVSQDRDALTDDPESVHNIVHENFLFLFPLALFIAFLTFGLVITFSE